MLFVPTGVVSFLAHFFSSLYDFPAARWKAMALNDGSGLGRQELERLDSLLDKRIETLSAQLAKLNKISQVGEYPPQLTVSKKQARVVGLGAGLSTFPPKNTWTQTFQKHIFASKID